MIIFLSAPFTSRIEPTTGLLEKSYREWLDSIIQHLRSKGHQVTNAHVREDWGADLDSPEVAIEKDYNLVRDCDLVVAYPGIPPSPGVHLELGLAVALKKPIIMVHENHPDILPYLDRGLGKMTKTCYISFTSVEDLIEQLDEKLEAITGALSNFTVDLQPTTLTMSAHSVRLGWKKRP